MAGGGAIHSSVDDAVGWIVVDHPARHNALTRAMMAQLAVAASTLDDDPKARVVVIRGAGKAFISGADISQFSEMQSSADAETEFKDSGGAMFAAIAALKKPLIAMINGHCIGGGLMVALQADLRIAADTATFGIPAARLGVGYPYSAVKMVTERVGPLAAAEILLTGQRFSATRAEAMGLVNKVVTSDALESECRALAHTIAANAPLTVRTIKRGLRAYMENPAQADDAEAARLAETSNRS